VHSQVILGVTLAVTVVLGTRVPRPLADAVAALEGLVAAMDKRRPPVGAEGGYTGIFGSYEFDDAREALARLKGGEQ